MDLMIFFALGLVGFVVLSLLTITGLLRYFKQ